MANKTIGGLTAGDAIVGTEKFETEIATGPASRYHTAAQIAAYVASTLGRPGFRFTIDLDSTADSDPGAGLLKFNHATPSSATFLYIDDATVDGVDLSTYFGNLGATGFARLVAANDPGEWAVFKWSAVTDGTGYWKLAVVHQAGLGSFEDADEVLVLFDSDAAGGTVADDSITNAKLANVATKTLKGRTSASTGDPEDLTVAQARALLGTRVEALTDATTIAVDASLADCFRVTLGGNRTLVNPTNLIDGQPLNVRITQDGTGSRTLAYGSKYKFPGGVAPVLSTAAGAKDLLCCVYDATDDTLLCVLQKAFA